MTDHPEPMTTLDEDEWRLYKRATRNLRHRQRMQEESPRELGRRIVAWSWAVERDSSTDPAERDQTIKEQAA